jgi:gas vesicle protein
MEEMPMSTQNNQQNEGMNAKDFLIGTLIGGLVGAATALLLSPKSGPELRGDIAEGYQSATQHG